MSTVPESELTDTPNGPLPSDPVQAEPQDPDVVAIGAEDDQ